VTKATGTEKRGSPSVFPSQIGVICAIGGYSSIVLE
jgi:hypothetical protein